MMKNSYERAVLTVLALDTKDIITTSTYTGNTQDGIVLPEDIF